MRSSVRSQHGISPERVSSGRMSTLERARAHEGMTQAMMLGNLTLKACERVRTFLKAAGRSLVPKRAFSKRGMVHFD